MLHLLAMLDLQTALKAFGTRYDHRQNKINRYPQLISGNGTQLAFSSNRKSVVGANYVKLLVTMAIVVMS